MESSSIYLDYAATTPVDPGVVHVMSPYFTEDFGNPSSVHRFGQQAETALERARRTMAVLLDCQAEELIFTSCGSESDNLALRGTAHRQRNVRDAQHILVSAVEHDAILSTAYALDRYHGFQVEMLPTDEYGRVTPEELRRRIREDTAVVSVMYANNEIGSINDIQALATICREMAVPFHTDAVQAASQLPIEVDDLQVDLLSLGAHKFYGPKGIGALYTRSGTEIAPTLTGGAQEFGLRAGTQNVPLIVGMAEALRITQSSREQHNSHFSRLRDRLISGVLEAVPGAQLTGHPTKRLPNHASFVLRGIDGNALLAALDLEGFACSSGSACKTGDPEPSKVLLALGLSRELALGSLRVTVGRLTQEHDVERFLVTLPRVVQRLRKVETSR